MEAVRRQFVPGRLEVEVNLNAVTADVDGTIHEIRSAGSPSSRRPYNVCARASPTTGSSSRQTPTITTTGCAIDGTWFATIAR